jgi:hypothetical protein
MTERKRPQCRRCGGPLDFFYDPETDRQEWTCNNPRPLRTDEQYWEAWNNLPGDDVAHLEHDEMVEATVTELIERYKPIWEAMSKS